MKDRKFTPNNDINRRDEDFTDISNISGGITDEEFADEFLAYPADAGTSDAEFQFNFLGAELEKVNSAKNKKEELKR